MRRFLFLPVILLLAGCGNQPAPGSPPERARTQTQTPSVASPSPPLPGVGQTQDVKASGVTLTVTLVQVVRNTTTNSSVAVRKPGTRLVAIQLQVANQGGLTYRGMPTANLRNAAGNQIYGVFIETPVGQSFPLSYDVAAGDSYTGIMSFEVPDAEVGAYTHLYFTPGLGLPATVWQVVLA